MTAWLVFLVLDLGVVALAITAVRLWLVPRPPDPIEQHRAEMRALAALTRSVHRDLGAQPVTADHRTSGHSAVTDG